MRARGMVLSLASAIALVVMACAPSSQPTPKPGAQAAPAGQSGAAPAPAASTGGPTRVTIGVTETIESQNPYADSIALGYAVWCEVLGCLVSLVPGTSEYAPALAERWEVENPTTWVFHLRQNAKWSDGTPFTSADVIH